MILPIKFLKLKMEEAGLIRGFSSFVPGSCLGPHAEG